MRIRLLEASHGGTGRVELDLTGVTRMLNVNYAEPVPAFLCAGLCYVLITLAGGLLGGVLERRTRIGR